MRVSPVFLSLLMLFAAPSWTASAAPTTEDVAPFSGPLAIPFEPPLGKNLRYRAEKSDQKNGTPRLSWEVFDASFSKHGDGYRLTVTPIDSGTDGQKSAGQIAFEKKIQELTKRPFVVEISADGTISGLVDEAKYWTEIERALIAAANESADDNERKALTFVSSMFKDMPPEAKAGLLTQDLAPLVEFAAADLEEAGDVVPFEFETTSMFNTKVAMEGTISVLGADDDVAIFSIVSRIAPDALKKVTAELFAKLPVDPAKKSEAEAALAAMKHMRHETRGKYAVSRADGTLIQFTGNQEISVESGGKNDHQIVTKTLTRVD